MSERPTTLAGAIQSLRSELEKAIEEKPDDGVQFTVESIDLEMQVTFQSEVALEGSGGWSLLGWQVGGRVGMRDTDIGVHKVKMTLKPKVIGDNGEGGSVNVAGHVTHEQ